MKRLHLFMALLIAPVVLVLIAAMAVVCADRSYAEDEEVFDNHWKVLTLIYQHVDTPDYKKSFTDAQVAGIKNVASNLPDNYRRLSGGRFLIDSIEFKTIKEPVTSVSGDGPYPNWLTMGPGNDIDFDRYLEGNDVDFVVVFAPVGDYPGNTWYGLGGSYYEYNGRQYNYTIINNVLDLVGQPNYKLPDGTYDTRLGALVHEMLHGIESNSRKNGINDFQNIHDAEANGYSQDRYGEWFDWYRDVMRDTIKSGNKGFSEESFYVHHKKRVYPESLTFPQASMDVKTGEKIQLAPSVLPEGSEGNFIYKSSDPFVATVSKTGMVSTYYPGKTVITVSMGNSDLTAKVTLKVTGADKRPIYKVYDGKLNVRKNRDGSLTLVSVNKNVDRYLYLGTVWFQDADRKINNIAPYAFKNNRRIKFIQCYSQVKTVGKGAFYGMTKLEKLYLGKNIVNIPANMCKKCRRLRFVKASGVLKSVGKYAFTGIRKKPCVKVRKKTPLKLRKKIKRQIKTKVRTF